MTVDIGSGLIAVGAGLAVGLAGLGTGFAEKDIGSAVVGAITEDPKMFVKGIVLMMLPETILLLGFVMAFLLMSRM
jgi:V/A-type H+-transporting ATPase subunit K